MTDTEKVIEELQSASKWFAEHGRNTNTAIVGICDRAVDEINRQRAAIESLQRQLHNAKLHEAESVKVLKAERRYKDHDEHTIKIETFKKFAERLKENFETYSDDEETNALYMTNKINDLLKEMVGEYK